MKNRIFDKREGKKKESVANFTDTPFPKQLANYFDTFCNSFYLSIYFVLICLCLLRSTIYFKKM